jgi:hypothetical protein
VTITPDANNSGYVCENQTFTASIVGGTPPITYTWSTDGLQSGQGTTTAVYQWSATCGKTVTVTAADINNQVQDSVNVTLTLNLSQICDAIDTTITSQMTDEGSIQLVPRAYGWDNLPEGINDQPALLTRWAETIPVDATTDTDRTTFGGIRQKDIVFYADYVVSTRNNLAENNQRLTLGVSQIHDILEQGEFACTSDGGNCPPFGLCALKSFKWGAEQVSLEHGGILYYTARFTITVRVY